MSYPDGDSIEREGGTNHDPGMVPTANGFCAADPWEMPSRSPIGNRMNIARTVGVFYLKRQPMLFAGLWSGQSVECLTTPFAFTGTATNGAVCLGTSLISRSHLPDLGTATKRRYWIFSGSVIRRSLTPRGGQRFMGLGATKAEADLEELRNRGRDDY